MSITPEATKQEPEATTPAHRPHRRSLRYRTLKFIRRTHTYTGIFMTPLLLVYGLSSIIFNHPRLFPVGEQAPAADVAFPDELFNSSRLAAIPQPDVLAARVIEAYNADEGHNEKFTLASGPAPRYANYLMLNGESGPGRFNLQIDLNKRKGVYHLFKPAAPEAGPKILGRVGAFTLHPGWQKGLQQDLRQQTTSTTVPVRSVATGAMTPELAFTAESGGKTYNMRYRLGNGMLTVNEQPWTKKTTAFLLRMHMTARYQSISLLRTLWAIQVDLFSVLLCGWALSGIIIWLQMKNLRRWGLATLALMAIYFAVVGVGMYRLLL